MSLRWRLVLILGALAIAAVGVASVGSFASTRDELQDEIDAFLVRRADELLDGRRRRPVGGARSGRGPGTTAVQGLGAPSDTSDPDAVTQTVDATGAVTGTSSTAVVLPVSADEAALAASGGQGRILRDATVGGVDYRMITVAQPAGGALQVARPLTEADDVLHGVAGRLVLMGLMSAAAAGVVGWFFARRVTRPLRELTAAAEGLATTRDMPSPVVVKGSDEVASLARSFNTMVGALETSKRQQRQLVLDAGHELRTPLTSLRMSIDLLQRGGRLDDDERQRLLDRAQVELVELTDLVTEVIELAADRMAPDEPEQAVDLAEVVADAAEAARRRTGRAVDVWAEDAGTVWGRASMIDRAVANLLGNAHKFSPDGAPIDVVVTRGRIAVRDRGPGIPATERGQVFDRFYRTDTARALPGSGLGLAIVRRIVDEHGGRVWAAEAPGGGAEVGFALPLMPVGTPAALAPAGA